VNSEVDQAMSFACRILAYRRRTMREMTKRLAEHGFSPEVTCNVIDTLTQYGYIDDKVYDRLWFEQRLHKRGFAGLKRELLQKGVDSGTINETIEELEPKAEYQAALSLASKKLTISGGNCPFTKLARFLQNRGYSYEIISRVCRTITENHEQG
jgi:regulatory protein